MKSFRDKLQDSWERKTSILCFGMDPVIERMKIDKSKNLSDEIVKYFIAIMKEIMLKITAVKPNLAYYLQYGSSGIEALLRLVNEAKKNELPVILDGKFGDIGRTSEAYARFAFDIIQADAVTLNPYMGFEALNPFFKYRKKGYFVLALTSNPGAKDFQYLKTTNDNEIYYEVIESVIDKKDNNEGLGVVIGATQKEVSKILKDFSDNKNFIPLLIPGVGSQGGSYKKINSMLDEVKYEKGLVRINSSSYISFAHERFPGFDYTEAAYLAVEEILKS